MYHVFNSMVLSVALLISCPVFAADSPTPASLKSKLEEIEKKKRALDLEEVEIHQALERLESPSSSVHENSKSQLKRPGLLVPIEKSVESLFQLRGIEVFRSLEEEGRPAVFSWAHERGAQDVYRTDSALRISKPGIVTGAFHDSLYTDLNLGFEAHATSAKKTRKSNSLKWVLSTESIFHIGGAKNWTRAERRYIEQYGDIDPSLLGAEGTALLMDANVVYTLSPITNRAETGGELTFSFNQLAAGFGRYQPLFTDLMRYRGRLYGGFEGGGVVDVGEDKKAAESTSHYLRLAGRARADFHLRFLSEQLYLSGDYRYWHLLTSGSHSRSLGVISLTYQLTDHLSVGGSFTDGRRPPSFERERTVGVDLGVQF